LPAINKRTGQAIPRNEPRTSAVTNRPAEALGFSHPPRHACRATHSTHDSPVSILFGGSVAVPELSHPAQLPGHKGAIR